MTSTAHPDLSRRRPLQAERDRVYLVATPGGHLDLLMALRPQFEAYDRVWVVSAGSTADALVADGEDVRLLPRFHGFSAGSLRLAAKSLGPVLRERPGVVVTSGSGSVVPFCTMARALGARLMFIETMARVHDASDAGRVLSRVADRVLVQWPEMLSVYAHAKACRPVLIDQVDTPSVSKDNRVGTFVAVGTHLDPFDRMLRTADEAVSAGVLPGPALAQAGVCGYAPQRMATEQWMKPSEMEAAVHSARYVLCHAGSGMIARTLGAGLTPLVMPRRHEHGEHVDDHQLQITDKLGELGLVVPIRDRIEPEHLKAADAPRASPEVLSDLPSMSDVIVEELAALVAAPPRRFTRAA